MHKKKRRLICYLAQACCHVQSAISGPEFQPAGPAGEISCPATVYLLSHIWAPDGIRPGILNDAGLFTERAIKGEMR
jgi:hypothetical protein